MFRKAFLAGALSCCLASGLYADFRYEQTSKITGGMMAGMMKFAGAFSKQAREPMQSTVLVKGDRMATISNDRIHVIDLSKETMTEIDMKAKSYSVITFADMARAMAKMSEKAGQKSNDAELDFKLSVKDTGASRTISGFSTKEKILLITMEGTDKKSGQKGGMTMTTDMWIAPSLPGYEEVRNFYARMAQKMAWTPGAGMLGAMGNSQPGMAKGFSELYKEASKIDGVPVLQVVRMNPTGATGANMPSDADMAKAQEAMAQAQAAQEQQPPPPSAGTVAGNAAGSAATSAALGKLGKFGGMAGIASGGFGGFGRKKKTEPEQTTPAPPPPAPAKQDAAPAVNGMGAVPPGTLMELTTEVSGFSSAQVDSSKFEIPAGFKQVASSMEKALK